MIFLFFTNILKNYCTGQRAYHGIRPSYGYAHSYHSQPYYYNRYPYYYNTGYYGTSSSSGGGDFDFFTGHGKCIYKCIKPNDADKKSFPFCFVSIWRLLLIFTALVLLSIIFYKLYSLSCFIRNFKKNKLN